MKRCNVADDNMTIYSHVMDRYRIKTAEFKARLSEYLRQVRGGRTLTILDRNTPIARVTPIHSGRGLTIREPSGDLGEVPRPPPLRVDVDVVELLREERGDR